MPLDGYFDEIFRECIRTEEDLHDYQDEAIEWLWERPYSALYIDVGMGKTVIVSSILDRLLLQGFAGKILIVAPIRVANRVWMQEHRLWTHLAYFRPTLLRVDDDDPRLTDFSERIYDITRHRLHQPSSVASRARRRAKTALKWQLMRQLLETESQIHVINKEAVDWLVSQYVEVVRVKGKKTVRFKRKWPYAVVIVDEASVLGDYRNVIFDALKNVRSKLERFHELTASPASQTYMRFFSQIYLLDEGERFGRHITHFRERYFNYNRWARTWTLREGADKEIEEKIADICLVMRREKDFVINTRRIQLPSDIKKQYQDFERESVLELRDKVIDAINGAALSNKLLQFASGAVYDENRKYHIVHSEKIEELRQLSEETLDNPIMVSYWYRSSLDRLRKAFPQAAIMDKEGKVEADWNRSKFKMMFVHPRGVAHGLNLQFGGHHLALYDIFWPLDLFTQLIGRLDRQGQMHTVMVHLLSAVGTHDEVVSANLEYLRTAEDAMFGRLQALQRKYRSA